MFHGCFYVLLSIYRVTLRFRPTCTKWLRVSGVNRCGGKRETRPGLSCRPRARTWNQHLLCLSRFSEQTKVEIGFMFSLNTPEERWSADHWKGTFIYTGGSLSLNVHRLHKAQCPLVVCFYTVWLCIICCNNKVLLIPERIEETDLKGHFSPDILVSLDYYRLISFLTIDIRKIWICCPCHLP